MGKSLSAEGEEKSSQGIDMQDNRSKKTAILCGGHSNEREVSLASAANVQQTLMDAGYPVLLIDTASRDFMQTLKEEQPDVAFIALHGRGGEDGTLQAVLEFMNIPYTGSGVLGSALAMDKHRSKIMYEALGLCTAPWLTLKQKDCPTAKIGAERVFDALSLPVVVKPSEGGSSVGISIVKDKNALSEALKAAFETGGDVVIEQFIQGVEITVSVLGAEELVALPTIEIVAKNDFYDYESKYAQGGSEHIIPARLSTTVLEEAARVACAAHEGIGCYGISRTDMIVDKENTIWVIETNTIPGMTNTSLLPDAAAYVGMSNLELYERIIYYALERAKG